MLRAKWIVLLFVSPLLPAAALADDASDFGADSFPSSAAYLIPQSLDADSELAPRWPLTYAIGTLTDSDDWSRSITNVEFQDSGVLGRISKLRGVSFLTLAEFGQTRLFFGVNKEGLVGVHFRAFARRSDTRYLEIARLPYLKKRRSDSGTE